MGAQVKRTGEQDFEINICEFKLLRISCLLEIIQIGLTFSFSSSCAACPILISFAWTNVGTVSRKIVGRQKAEPEQRY